MVQHVATLVKKYGHCDVLPNGRIRGVYSVVCQGCGKKISTSDSGEAIDYVVTKRGTAMFWHSECFDKATKNKIKWNNQT